MGTMLQEADDEIANLLQLNNVKFDYRPSVPFPY